MNKSQLIDTLAARFEGNRKAAAHALDSVLDTITREVAKGEKVAITGFGSFEKRVRGLLPVAFEAVGQGVDQLTLVHKLPFRERLMVEPLPDYSSAR